MGTPRDFTNFINAVIDEASFDNIVSYIEKARSTPDAEIIAGGKYDKSKGFFVEPTVILARDPKFVTMVDEVCDCLLIYFMVCTGVFVFLAHELFCVFCR